MSTKSFLETRRKFIRQFNASNKKGPSDALSKAMIMRWVKQFRKRGTVLKQSPPGPAKSVRTQANSVALKQSVQQSPTRSTRHRSQALGIKRTSLMRLLKESNLKAYRLSVRQKLTDGGAVPEVPWPPHSPDLSPPDFMLWGHVKSRVYETKPSTIQQLKAAISEKDEASQRGHGRPHHPAPPGSPAAAHSGAQGGSSRAPPLRRCGCW